MREIRIHFAPPDEDSRRRNQKRGAAGGLLFLGAILTAAWAGRPPKPSPPPPPPIVIEKTVTVFQTATTATTATTAPTPPLPARLLVAPAQLVFAQPDDGSTPPPQLLRVRNSGELPLALSPPAARGRSFRVSNDCPPQLAKGESCGVAVSFDAAVAGSARDRLTIRGSSGATEIPLSGTARTWPAVELQPLDFGRQIIGSHAEPRTLRVTNSAPSPIAIGTISIPSPFHTVSDHCTAARLLPGGTCDVVIDFDPTAVGAFDHEIAIPCRTSGVVARAAIR